MTTVTALALCGITFVCGLALNMPSIWHLLRVVERLEADLAIAQDDLDLATRDIAASLRLQSMANHPAGRNLRRVP